MNRVRFILIEKELEDDWRRREHQLKSHGIENICERGYIRTGTQSAIRKDKIRYSEKQNPLNGSKYSILLIKIYYKQKIESTLPLKD